MKKIKHLLLTGALLLLAFAPVLSTNLVHAQVSDESKDAACQGLGGATGDACTGDAGSSVGNLVASIINILSWIVGLISIVMMIVGGLKFVTSNGNAQAISSARSTVIYALVGVVVAVVAQVLVRFVVTRVDASGDNGGANGVNLCVVDSQGRFLSNPYEPEPCAM